MTTLQIGSTGVEVRELQQKLKDAGFDPGVIDGEYGHGTEAAVLAFQKSEGLLADGIAGPRTLAALCLAKPTEIPSVIPGVTVAVVSQMFPHTPLGNIKANLPPVLESLVDADLTDTPMVLAALATIRAETESFEPIAEGRSRFNTSPNGHPFDLYDNRKDLGNQGPPDGKRFRGRGYIQLTGRFNYDKYGAAIGIGDQLLNNPERASDPHIAAQLLSAFLKDKEVPIKEALRENDLKAARRLVNGGAHGLDRFSDAYTIGLRLIG
ncbi:MAG: peptidoglycan-binding protein [Nitrospirae bacterium]|nr:MAG: peptidoglycan-binding protein [Nitrospirota bacterium]